MMMDSDDFAVRVLSVLPPTIKARFRMTAKVDGSGYDTIESEIWDAKTRSWIPLTKWTRRKPRGFSPGG